MNFKRFWVMFATPLEHSATKAKTTSKRTKNNRIYNRDIKSRESWRCQKIHKRAKKLSHHVTTLLPFILPSLQLPATATSPILKRIETKAAANESSTALVHCIKACCVEPGLQIGKEFWCKNITGQIDVDHVDLQGLANIHALHFSDFHGVSLNSMVIPFGVKL